MVWNTAWGACFSARFDWRRGPEELSDLLQDIDGSLDSEHLWFLLWMLRKAENAMAFETETPETIQL